MTTHSGATLALCLCLAGCGGSSKVKTDIETRTVSVGQELQDLETARNEGLLTEAEYNRQRKKVLDR